MAEVRKRKGDRASSTTPEPSSPPSPTRKETLKGDDAAEQQKFLIDDAKFAESKSSGAWTTALIVVSILSFLTRTFRIDHPNQVVYYLRREYFFDVHPPLGKLLLAGMGYFIGYDGHFLFENIGDDYVANKVPYIGLRMLPASFGALVVPVAFLILKELGVSLYGAIFGALLLILAVPYGAKITIKHRENSVFLHSHVDKYPLRYDDGRISSQGQQVTGYPHRDPNNEWEIIPVDPKLYPAASDYTWSTQEKERGVRYLRHEDIVRLRHIVTDSFLLTHDVASPLTTTNMEITTYASSEDQAARYTDTLWKVDVTDGEGNMKVHSRRSHFRLVSVPHKVAIHASKSLLPDWGFGQSEINGNKNQLESSNVWYIEEVIHERIVNGTEIGEEVKPEKKVEKKRSFLSKFIELQNLMISHNAGLTKPHPYSSTPITWPFVLRGISFWEVKEGLKQIYLLGNPLIWWTSITGTLMYAAMWVLDRILLRRGIDDFGTAIRRWWDRGIGFLFITWLLHWLPFFLMGRMLFLHHYLPSFIFSTLVATAVFEFVGRIVMEDPVGVAKGNTELAERIPFRSWMKKSVSILYIIFLTVTLGSFIWSFFYFAPLTYGLGFNSVEDLRTRKWMSSWDLQHA
ncbi:hypothetical protein HDU96_001316 [Phlyctochytrium bullatum]|nr:hypothetical protein HDU96_001316 [Phlyctochytrium bullatum]